jgi:hypothetical protein
MDSEPDYARRAGVAERPAIWVDDLTDTEHVAVALTAHPLFAAAANRVFFADTSTYQPFYDSTYPHPVASFRADTGYRADSKAAGNWQVISRLIESGKVRVVIAYVVYIPGNNQGILTRVRELFGQSCPDRLCFRVDVESGPGFAGPGNHSTGANQLAGMLADYAGSWARVEAYANRSDYQSGWPQIDGRLKKCTASYSTNDPSPYSWQYYGALPYPSPVGYPRSCPPFGSYVDMNVINRGIDQIERDYGVQATPAPEPIVEGDDVELWLLRGTPSGFWLAGGRAITSNENSTRIEFKAQGGKVYTISDEDEFNRIKNSFLVS